MATLEQARSYNTLRGNELWKGLDNAVAAALLKDAEDYIRGAYPIRAILSDSEQRTFDGIVCRLASVFQVTPPAVAASPAIKKESKEGVGFKKEVEYVAAGSDPYPYVTAILRGLLATASASSGFTIARLVR